MSLTVPTLLIIAEFRRMPNIRTHATASTYSSTKGRPSSLPPYPLNEYRIPSIVSSSVFRSALIAWRDLRATAPGGRGFAIIAR